jgi:SNF2 family DNA or RNA helicase
MLRRVKTEIEELNLPARIVKVEECEFEESEEFVYDQLRTVAESKIDQMGEKNDMMSALVLLLRLRQGQWYGVIRVVVF